MFDKYIIDNRSNIEAASIIAESNRNHDRTLKAISEAEIKSKDRVNISLEEYTRMQEEIKTLSRDSKNMAYLLAQIGIPPEIINRIDRNSVHVEHCADIRDFKTHYRVSFSADDSPRY